MTPGPRRVPARRVFWLTLAGLLLVQAAWILVVPPFRNIDEHEHVYKAAAVARGDWSADHELAHLGWGEVLVVPEDLVAAARPVCETLPGTTDDNCRPGRDMGGGLVEVASAAARYNPLYYAVVGIPALPFSGTAALYVMRAVSAVLCALLLAGAAAVLSRWSVRRWPLATFMLTLTPVVLYSTTVVAPNGIEMGAAALLWASLLGLCRAELPAADRNRLLGLAALAAVPLVTVRSLGPLWCLLIVLCALPLAGRARLAALARARATWLAAATVAAATAPAAAWAAFAGTNEASGLEADFDESLATVLPRQWLLWFFQSVGAFPYRDEIAPLGMIALYLTAMAVVAVFGALVGGSGERLSMLAVFVLGSAVPLVATAAVYTEIGAFWQGRYTFPLTLGLLMICGFAFDRSAERIRTSSVLAATAIALTWGVSEIAGQLHVLDTQTRTSPLSGTEAWTSAPPWVIALIIAAGTALLLGAVLAHRPAPSPAERAEPAAIPR